HARRRVRRHPRRGAPSRLVRALLAVSQVLVAFTSSYRPLATGLGVVSLELLAALALANRFRQRLSYRFWRRTHYLEFAVWTLALAHGIASGTDSGTPWGVLLYGVAAG